MNVRRYTTLPYLYKLLNTKTISAVILGINFLFIFSMNLVGLMVFLISALAIPFSLYMLLVLYKYDKKRWITGFLLWMCISFLPLFLMPGDNLFLIAYKFAPLLFFVLFTIVLKIKVGEWLIENEYELNRM